MLKAEAVSRATCVAFAIGHHQRLWLGLLVEGLDPQVVHKVIEQVRSFRRCSRERQRWAAVQ